jgi:nicotinamide riboside kinase
MALTIALLGGESSGKTTLAKALHEHLQDRLGIPTVLVSEQLRHWCETMGRAPRAEEQAARADEQAQRIEAARQQPDVRIVIADTTALVIATYSELYFNDRSLHPAALAQQRTYDFTLLMGLDLPWVADGLFRDSPAVREATDAVLRRELQDAGIPFQTVYGQGQARLQQALRCIGNALGQTLVASDPAWPQGRRPWNCEKCSDPDCEHRLFTQLIARQRAPEAKP